MATYAIGDIQGCMAAFSQLLDAIRFTPRRDKLWLVGDLVNRGPDSLAVLRHVKGLGQAAVSVLGNHDLHLLAVAAGATKRRKKDSLDEVLDAPDRADLLAWLRAQSLLYQEGQFVLVHAGLLPQWTVGMAIQRAREAERALRGDAYGEVLRTLYADGVPTRWSDDLSGAIRAAVIVNVLTKLRVCTPDGEMDLSFKGEPKDIPPGMLPWFKISGRRNTDAHIICGHWSALGLHLEGNVTAVDTGCVWGHQLTAVRLEDRQVIQVPCPTQCHGPVMQRPSVSTTNGE